MCGATDSPEDEMIYEIREDTTVPGRIPALVRRFNDHTLGLFARHGTEVVFLSRTAIADGPIVERISRRVLDPAGFAASGVTRS